MEVQIRHDVKITGMRISKPFIKIFVRLLQGSVETSQKLMKTEFESANESESFSSDDLCIAYLRDSPTKYERCRIIQATDIENYVTINLYDLGIQALISKKKLRRINPNSELLAWGVQSREFIIAEIRLRSNLSMPSSEVNEILRQLNEQHFLNEIYTLEIYHHRNFNIRIVQLLEGNYSSLIDKIFRNEKYSQVLEKISKQDQIQAIMEIREDSFNQASIYYHNPLNYSCTDDNKMTREVQILDYEDGIKSFYVRYTNDRFHEFQTWLQNTAQNLRRNWGPLLVGHRFLVYFQGKLFRCAISNLKPTRHSEIIEVLLIDIGKRIQICSRELYVLPSQCSRLPAMAKQFKLAGFSMSAEATFWDTENRESQYKFYFKYLTKDKMLRMKKIEDEEFPNTSKIPSCYLYFCENGEEVNKKIKQFNPHNHAMIHQSQPKLSVSSHCEVKVLNKFSSPTPICFYVHLKENTKMLDEIERILGSLEFPKLPTAKIGDLVAGKFRDQWMRWEISKKVTDASFKLFSLDYGFSEDFSCQEIRLIPDNLAVFPPLAYRCCLEGFQSRETVNLNVNQEMEYIIQNQQEYVLNVESISKHGTYIVSLINKSFKSISTELLAIEKSPVNNSNWSPSSKLDSRVKTKRQDIQVFSISPEKFDDAENTLQNIREPLNSTAKNPDEIDPISGRSAVRRDIFSRDSSQHHDSVHSTSSGIGSSSSENGDLCPMKITEITSIKEFTIMKSSLEKEYERFQNKIKELAEAAFELDNPSLGVFCYAFSSISERWFRSEILDIDDEPGSEYMVAVRSIDDGSKFCVTEKKFLRDGGIDICTKNPFGIKCSLPIQFHKRRSDELDNEIKKLQKRSDIKFKEIAIWKDITFIEIYSNGENFVNFFTKRGICQRIFVVPKGFAKIILIENSSDFVIRMTSDEPIFEEIQRIAKDNKYQNAPTDSSIGKLVFAKHKLEWRRAVITRKIEKKVEVYFIDFGTEGSTDEICELDDAVKDIPPLAIKCSLEKIGRCQQTEVDFRKNLNKIVKIEMVTPGFDSAKVMIIDDAAVDDVNIIVDENEIEWLE